VAALGDSITACGFPSSFARFLVGLGVCVCVCVWQGVLLTPALELHWALEPQPPAASQIRAVCVSILPLNKGFSDTASPLQVFRVRGWRQGQRFVMFS